MMVPLWLKTIWAIAVLLAIGWIALVAWAVYKVVTWLTGGA